MSANLRAYQAQQFAKYHYRSLISAKTSLKYFHKQNTLPVNISRTVSPLDLYEHTLTNNKLCGKLTEIYEASTARKKKLKRKPKQQKQKTNSVSENGKALKQKTIDHQNVKIFERILAAKSTICQDWKQREKSLKKYGKIARKRQSLPEENLFNAFQELLAQSRKNAGRRHYRAASARPRSGLDLKSTYNHKKLSEKSLKETV